MKEKTTHRVVTFLTREEMDFLDKLEKDMMFSSGRSVSRSQIIEDLAEILGKTGMDAKGIADNEALKARIMQAIANLSKEWAAKKNGKA